MAYLRMRLYHPLQYEYKVECLYVPALLSYWGGGIEVPLVTRGKNAKLTRFLTILAKISSTFKVFLGLLSSVQRAKASTLPVNVT